MSEWGVTKELNLRWYSEKVLNPVIAGGAQSDDLEYSCSTSDSERSWHLLKILRPILAFFLKTNMQFRMSGACTFWGAGRGLPGLSLVRSRESCAARRGWLARWLLCQRSH
jgi:hypothetical protein